MNSFNHYAYGAIGEWMYRYLAGVDMDMEENEPAYKKILIQPHFAAGRLQSAAATLESPYGMIESSWEESSGERRVQVKIPVNTAARIILPGATLAGLTEGPVHVQQADGIISAVEADEGVTLTAGSGNYSFCYTFGE